MFDSMKKRSRPGYFGKDHNLASCIFFKSTLYFIMRSRECNVCKICNTVTQGKGGDLCSLVLLGELIRLNKQGLAKTESKNML